MLVDDFTMSEYFLVPDYRQADRVGQPGLQQGSCNRPMGRAFWVRLHFTRLAGLGFRQHFVNICAVDLRSVDSESLATLALLGVFGAFQGLLTYRADLMVPD